MGSQQLADPQFKDPRKQIVWVVWLSSRRIRSGFSGLNRMIIFAAVRRRSRGPGYGILREREMKKRITQSDYVKANRRASRQEEIAAHGRPVGFRRVHESKKSYNRKKIKAGLKRLPDFLYVRFVPGGFSDRGADYSILSVFGCRNFSWIAMAAATITLSQANPAPKSPPSVHLPSMLVTAAPANTPIIFIIP